MSQPVPNNIQPLRRRDRWTASRVRPDPMGQPKRDGEVKYFLATRIKSQQPDPRSFSGKPQMMSLHVFWSANAARGEASDRDIEPPLTGSPVHLMHQQGCLFRRQDTSLGLLNLDLALALF